MADPSPGCRGTVRRIDHHGAESAPWHVLSPLFAPCHPWLTGCARASVFAEGTRTGNRPVSGRSCCHAQECGFFGQELRYEPRGCWDVRMVTWGGCGATGSFSCLEVGQLQWPPSGCTGQRLGHRRRSAFFWLCLRACRCVRESLGADLAAASWVACVGVRRRAWLVLMGSWRVYMVRTMCCASPCYASVSDPICVLALLLCRLQVCHHYNDERSSLVCVWAGFSEHGDVILGVRRLRRQGFVVGERRCASWRVVCGSCRKVGWAARFVLASSR